jgi:hypothetical protein
MSEKVEVQKLAREIAERFAEIGERPRAQIERMVELMGAAWLVQIADQAEREIAEAGPATLRTDGTARTRSGVFFALARRAAFKLVGESTLRSRDFYRTFCWRERKPREPKPVVPQRKAPKDPAARPTFAAKPKAAGPAPRRKLPAAEVYAVRRPTR